jgi:hypothetical protein
MEAANGGVGLKAVAAGADAAGCHRRTGADAPPTGRHWLSSAALVRITAPTGVKASVNARR